VLRAFLLCGALLAPAGAGAAITGADVAEIRAAIHRQLDACRAVPQPAKLAFLELIVMSNEIVQQVQVTDGSGAVWLAYYSMERERDGGWRTSGCHLRHPARPISA
jgi:Domain of unknown function (DUF4864)